MIDRNAVTNYLLTTLADTNVPVGDHVAPQDSGWSMGQPNVDEFSPYLVLASGTASTVQGTLCSDYWDWRMQYAVKCHGVTRFTCDELMHRVCLALTGLPRFELGKYRSNIVRVDSLSAVQPNKAVSPYYWSGTVNVSVDMVRMTV